MKLQRTAVTSSILPAILLLAGASVVLLALTGNAFVPPMDDSYIHLVYGRSLLSGDPLCYNGRVPSSGFTSPLWLIPSALASLAGGSAASFLIMLMSLAAAAATLAALPTMTAILLLSAGPFFFHSATGMETSLSCLAVVMVWKWIENGGGLAAGSILLAGSLLLRPELAVLGLPMAYALDRRSPVRVIRLVIPSTIAGALWMAWNLHSTGLPLPSTFYAKQAVGWIPALTAGWKGLATGLLLTSPLLLFASVTWITGSFRDRKKGRKEKALSMVPIALFSAALFTQPNSYFQMRYYVPFIASAALAAGNWLRGLGSRKRVNALILVASMIPGLVVFGIRRYQAAIDVLYIDVMPAEYLESMSDESDTVAAADIGAVKWITGLEVLDLDGLVTIQRLPGEDRQGWSWISSRSDYLLVFPGQYSDLLETAEGDIHFLTGYRSPSNVICGEDSISLWRIE